MTRRWNKAGLRDQNKDDNGTKRRRMMAVKERETSIINSITTKTDEDQVSRGVGMRGKLATR